MVAELIVGYATNSLALLADGVHMATHVGALGLSGVAYALARRWGRDEAFSFGAGKVYALSGYTSALILAVTALAMIFESVSRMLSPAPVLFAEALPVAVVGLVVNLLSAKLLGHDHDHSHDSGSHDHDHAEDHAHGHDHPHDHPHDHAHGDHGHHHAPAKTSAHHHDHNLRAAYLHVLADALTSVLAIGALLAGRYLGIAWLDPVMGIVGAVIILHWSWGLCRTAGRQLLDVAPSMQETRAIRAHLEAIDDVRVADLHVWDIGPGERGCIVKLVTSDPRDTAYYRDLIKSKVPISHLTVEVQRCNEQH
jgi:cation diffusion facilitator family transporter